MADRLASIRKQISALEKRASELMKAENKKVIDKIKALIAKHQLSAEDLGLAGGKVAAAAPARQARGAKRSAAGKKAGLTVGVPMYRDPKSGKTWTGRGKPPNWIVKAKDRTPFLIGSGDAAAEAPAKPAAQGRKAKAATKVARQPAAKKAAARKATAKRAAKVPAAPKPPKAAKAPRKAAKKAASRRTAKGPGKTAPPPPAAAPASTEA